MRGSPAMVMRQPPFCQSRDLRPALAAIDKAIKIREAQTDAARAGLARDLTLAAVLHQQAGQEAPAIELLKRAIQEWSMAQPGQLGSRGMKPDSMKPGDKITIRAHPMKDGSHGGQFMSATLADGRVFGQQGGGRGAPRSEEHTSELQS